MEIKQIFSFLSEITQCDYHPNYWNDNTSFTYNGITINQGYESYSRELAVSYEAFKTCALELALENSSVIGSLRSHFEREREQTFYDIPDNDYIKSMEREAQNGNPSLLGTIREAKFLNEMVGVQKWYFNEAIAFLNSLTGKETRATKTLSKVEEPQKREVETPLTKKLDDYGELLSVKDLTDIFQCDRRTITNWEAEGYIHNVAETSQETNSVGRRKRGKEKRYRKEAVLRQVKLQEKYNAILDR